jgi:lipoic acid synthetase
MIETASNPLNIRWLGKVSYNDALAVQKALFNKGSENYLLLLEHPHVFTLGVRGDTSNILVNPSDIGADLVKTNRGGDVTYHGPGQLVGYPILNLAGKRGGGMADTVAYVNSVEDLIIETLTHVGLNNCGRLDQYPGVWVNPNSENPRKIAAVGVRLTRGRTMHGFALNIEPDMTYFDSIIPCGIKDKTVTSLSREGIATPMATVVEVIAELASKQWGKGNSRRMDVSWRTSQYELSPFSKGEGPGKLPKPIEENVPNIPQPVTIGRKSIKQKRAEIAIGRKPEWMRSKANMGTEYRELKKSIKALELTTVCEEAGCPNIFECWGQGTATFMALGERCTRACGFCLVDTRKPQAIDPDEPKRIAEAVNQMNLEYAVITMVARDDLKDGGAKHISEIINEVRSLNPQTSVEVLISDLKGNSDHLQTIFSAKPDVMNHNIETVPRLQRQVRPSAGYARSLAVLALAKKEGLVVKSSIMVGLGETEQEMFDTLKDLKEIGVDIVTIGQYLRPTMNHLPVQRWWTPEEFNELKRIGEALGIPHVESSPLTRSSYHAKESETLAKNKANSLTTSGSK